ncbi:hypothetical protein ACIPL1_27555 [Pseudomonas sp. NPDC090202]|uniref:hypothetical protein n=1 Tax=Pseudomonas sp. NPDC090202 TaxID=3364476 RepID=UPI0038136AB5
MVGRIVALLAVTAGVATLVWQLVVVGYHFDGAPLPVRITILVFVGLFLLFVLVFIWEGIKRFAGKVGQWLRRSR